MPNKPAASYVTFVAGLIVFSAAFLLFVLELVTAKALLPRFGGSPMVWTTCMLVYQVLLLAGYSYAHGLSRLGSLRRQTIIYIIMLVAAVVVSAWRIKQDSFAGDGFSTQPFIDLMVTLAGTIALPFVVISSTSPLIQHWLRNHPARRPVYTLYAVSNVGSFAGLLAYPFLIEPLMRVDRQFHLWSLFFAVTAAGLMWMSLNVQRFSFSEKRSDTPDDGPQPSRSDRALWILLPATTSALLLSSTNELCQDLAVFPFLWVVPLSLYLLSFVMTFRTHSMSNMLAPAAVTTLIGMGAVSVGMMLPATVMILMVAALVFVLCIAVHRELYRLRPSTKYLTSFYLWTATGSSIGALSITLLPPLFFRGFWELPISVLAVWLVLVIATLKDPDGCMRKGDRRHVAALLGITLYLVINMIPEEVLRHYITRWPGAWSVPLRLAAATAGAIIIWLFIGQRRFVNAAIWPRVLAGLIIFLVESWLVQRIRNDLADSVHVSRNFFGVVRLQEMVHTDTGIHIRQLTHGRINHGFQYMNESLIRQPTAYHSRSSGIGRLLTELQAQNDDIHIGVTGLGAGALAAYPREKDRMTFYEIDPSVINSSSGDQAFFHFINNSPGKIDIVTGDARQSLRREFLENGSRRYDVLALDAFSSDAVPTHLLTREAFALYLDHLSEPNGVIAVNISNRFLDLEPVMADIARHYGLYSVMLDTLGDPPIRTRSLWVLMSRDAGILQASIIAEAARPLNYWTVAWTDSYSSPFALMKWWSPSARQVSILKGRNQKNVSTPVLSPEQTPGTREE